MAKTRWFKSYPTDLIGGIRSCATADQKLVYVVVLHLIYIDGAAIDNDPAFVGVIAGISRLKTARAIEELLAVGKLKLVGERLHNSRCEVELAEAAELSEKRSAAGKTPAKPKRNERQTRRETPNADSFDRKSDDEMAENRQLLGSNDQLERDRLERNPPHPIRQARRLAVDKPNFDEPIEPHERAGLIAQIDVVDRRDGMGQEVDIAALTSRIMTAARMTAPPSDLVLVRSWVNMGEDPEIIATTCARMAGSARGAIRGMRYFDQEIRDAFTAKQALSASNVSEFRAIAQRHAR